MITGCDISNNNKRNYRAIIDANPFVIMKATEGKTYKDPCMKVFANYALSKGKMIGFYHFARPDNGNSALAEAENFIESVKPYIGKAIFVLDYEGAGLNLAIRDKWAATWINTVKKKTGVLPLFYTSEAYLKYFLKVEKTGAGLWVAKYSTKKPSVSPWHFYALWQYKSYPYDKDKFNGNKAAWAAYAKVIK